MGNKFQLNILFKKKTFIDFLISNVDMKNCIYIDLSIREIKSYHAERERQHDLLIYGYDMQGQYAICRDYFSTKYGECRVPFNEVESSFMRKIGREERKDYNFLFRFQYPDTPSKPDIKEYIRIVKIMQESLHFYSYEPGTNKKIEFVFGLNAYLYLFSDYNKGLLKLDDLRPLYVIKDHLKLMGALSIYFQLPYDELLLKLKEQLEIICNLIIKYNITHDIKLKSKINELANQLVLNEKKYLESIVNWYTRDGLK